MRDNQYTIDGRIRFSEVDHTRRITLPGIVNYFQDCSTFQSEDLGLGIEHCSEKKRAWILSSWQVVVERYPKIGEKIQTSTWATDFNGLFGERNFCILPSGSGASAGGFVLDSEHDKYCFHADYG